MTILGRSASLPPLSEERRAEIMVGFEQRQATRKARARANAPKLRWWNWAVLPLAVGAVIWVAVAIGLDAAHNISGHRGHQGMLWAAFAVPLVAPPLWILELYLRHTIRPGHRPSDRLLRSVATTRYRNPWRPAPATTKTLAVMFALIGPILVATLAYHIGIGAPVLGFLDGFFAMFIILFPCAAWQHLAHRRNIGRPSRAP